jgi:hypothetical protein
VNRARSFSIFADLHGVLLMSQVLTLPDELFDKLARGAAQRGLTIEALLAFVSELVAMPDQPTKRDRERSRRIERLLARYQAGRLTERDRAGLEQLIDVDYQEAIARAGRVIATQEANPAVPTATAQKPRSSSKPAKRTRQ